MISKEQVEIFKKYNGDCDFFARLGQHHEKTLFKTNDWFIIETAFQDIELINTQKCSIDFKESVRQKINQNFQVGAIEL